MKSVIVALLGLCCLAADARAQYYPACPYGYVRFYDPQEGRTRCMSRDEYEHYWRHLEERYDRPRPGTQECYRDYYGRCVRR